MSILLALSLVELLSNPVHLHNVEYEDPSDEDSDVVGIADDTGVIHPVMDRPLKKGRNAGNPAAVAAALADNANAKALVADFRWNYILQAHGVATADSLKAGYFASLIQNGVDAIKSIPALAPRKAKSSADKVEELPYYHEFIREHIGSFLRTDGVFQRLAASVTELLTVKRADVLSKSIGLPDRIASFEDFIVFGKSADDAKNGIYMVQFGELSKLNVPADVPAGAYAKPGSEVSLSLALINPCWRSLPKAKKEATATATATETAPAPVPTETAPAPVSE